MTDTRAEPARGPARATRRQPANDATTRPIRARHVAGLLALGGIWGSSYLFIKTLVEEASPSAMVAVRFALGAGVLGAALALRRGRLPSRAVLFPHLLVMAIFGNVIPFALIAWSQQHATSALAAVLNATIPFFTLLVAAVVFRMERITPAQLVGIALGFAGVALLMGRSILDVGSAGGLAELALLASSACYGCAFAWARRHVHGDPLANVTVQLLIGGLLMTPFALRSGWVRPAELSLLEIGAWVTLGAAGTGAAYIIYYWLIHEIGATRASLSTYVIPPVGVLLGWLLLDESLGPLGLLGMLLIGLGIAVSYGVHRRVVREWRA